MTPVPEAAVLLAGFVLAHAAWSASDLPEGVLLVPLAVVEVDGERRLLRFEAETQEQAIAQGKLAMQKAMATADAWAFARDGLFDRGEDKVDVLSVDLWAKGMLKPVTLVQQYQPFAAAGKFRIVGDPIVVMEGVAQAPPVVADLLEAVQRGIRSHSKVVKLWDSWR
jgi:hypothetical protein